MASDDLTGNLYERFTALERALAKCQAERDAALVEAAQWKDATTAALVALHEAASGPSATIEARAALAEILTGYPPQAHTELVLIAAGETFTSEKPAYVIRRRLHA